ncbi:Cas10/Cmr2 second palm domain-containing protein [Aliarcobacter skirrowii]|uniref:Cas10/Cmr2 second palm domain-containing protein n=1 Tax=Aliarcobacter skirrowii TaxID=28200 RepID=UPI002A358DAA|nr:hypothetical protein [Aliarcobacter skirrowii]MDY0181452.1 hypothetical protein [Aliarcobacter skirrowii]
MSKYLYGASVQGIQDFIFKTNKLKEIIGASKIIEDMDSKDFQKEYNLKEKPEKLLQAAGNIRLRFNNKEDLEKVVKNFSKDIMLKAYGITISQAVVEDTNDYKKDSKELEKKLKIQRNKVSIPLDFHFNILKQNPRTALPLVSSDKDKATEQKVERFKLFADKQKKENRETIFKIEDLSNNKNKIAIIHADGNGLGNIVKELNETEIVKFSKDLDEATKEAYKLASEGIEKIREVILGGDDLTVIIDANEALKFTKKFLEEFEKATKNIHKGYDLTACAGITFCNEKYPFHYAVKLAEDLCSHAKKDSKDFAKEKNLSLAPSSIMFHNIQSSNVESFSKFIDDELTINGVRCDFGAYYLNEYENKPTIENLEKVIEDFKKENSPKGRLRTWLSDLEFDKTYAQNQLKRIKKMSEGKWKSENLSKLYDGLELGNLVVEKDEKQKTPIYDILQILSVVDENKDTK